MNTEKPDFDTPTEIADDDTSSVAATKPAGKSKDVMHAPRRKLSRSIQVRTIAINIAYSVAIIIMMWACFFVFIFGFYGRRLRDDMSDLGNRISHAFPYRVDDKAFERFKQAMSDTVRNEMVSVSVFTKTEDGENNVILYMDTLGNNIEQGTEAFDEFMLRLDDDIFERDEVQVIGTSIGDFLFYCGTNEIVTDVGTDTAYLLVVKPYQLFSPTIVSVIYALAGCSIVALALAVASSFLLSGFQNKRIKDISAKAKMLANGDYSVVFSGGGCEEYNDLANALNLAAEEMNKTEKLRRDMLANVSHDIRTPLTMIRGYAEMMRDMPLDKEKRKRMADIIIDETDRLNTLTGDVLSLSKLQSGVAEFTYERVNISKLARVTLNKFDIFSTRDGIVFACDIEDDAFAVCDAQRIMQVLHNFIGNAVNYCGDDKTVTLAVKKIDGGVRVEIGDHGQGIAEDEIDSVWYRYYRSAQSKRTTVGTGLGLSICKNILDSHGAKYTVTSELGKGTVFAFELKDEQTE